MNNIYSPLMPLSFGFHIGFTVISAVFLILYYILKRKNHTLILLIAVLSTLLIYFTENGTSFYILCAEEWVLTVILIISTIKDSRDEKFKERKAKSKQENTVISGKQENDENSDT